MPSYAFLSLIRCHLFCIFLFCLTLQAEGQPTKLKRASRSQRQRQNKELLVQAWQGPFEKAEEWPEDIYLSARSRKHGICFSGGGSRAYTAALGQLRALHDLQLLEHIGRIVGVSGGSWAVTVFSFAQLGAEVPDSVFLGEFWEPSRINLTLLAQIDNRSARMAVTRPIYQELIDIVAAHHVPYDQVWQTVLSRLYLEPVGIVAGSMFTWSPVTLLGILGRNPSLRHSPWVFPPIGRLRPFPIIETTLLGPFDTLPAPINSAAYVQIEVTPLYAGRPHISKMTYHHDSDVQSRLVGGLVEPIGYGMRAPAKGLHPWTKEGLLYLEATSSNYSVARGIAQSSFAPGMYLSNLSQVLSKLVEDRILYWSPVENHPQETDMAVADGGDIENLGLMSLLRRRVRNIVLFYNAEYPLVPKASWNPHSRPPTQQDIDSELPAYFGVFIDPPQEKGWTYRQNKVFEPDAFPKLAGLLQEEQSSGTGAVATVDLTTVKNVVWGIDAGIKARLTVFYLSRMSAWEDQLPKPVRDLVVPFRNASNPAVLRADGPFKSFPNYPTSWLKLSAEQANLLATLTASTVKYHASKLFDTIVGSTEDLVFV